MGYPKQAMMASTKSGLKSATSPNNAPAPSTKAINLRAIIGSPPRSMRQIGTNALPVHVARREKWFPHRIGIWDTNTGGHSGPNPMPKVPLGLVAHRGQRGLFGSRFGVSIRQIHEAFFRERVSPVRQFANQICTPLFEFLVQHDAQLNREMLEVTYIS